MKNNLYTNALSGDGMGQMKPDNSGFKHGLCIQTEVVTVAFLLTVPSTFNIVT
jgi:hypothetical protein